MSIGKFRFGIIGLIRGALLIDTIKLAGGTVTAICDFRPAAVALCKEIYFKKESVQTFYDYDTFIKADFDIVVLCNYFCDHAAFAIKAMRAGKHVLSETISNITMAEGVELCRVKEETGMMYALLENYPYFKQNLEMQRIFKEGTLGSLVYAEGEYVHPMDDQEQNRLALGERHWRNWTPRTYYTTHALAPLMQMTDSIPTRVTAFASFQPEVAKGTALQTGDAAAMILCQTNNNAIFRITGWSYLSPHGNWYRLCCTRGGVEINHGNENILLTYNHWCVPDGKEQVSEYPAKWADEELGQYADQAGHFGGDFMVIHHVIRCLEDRVEPYWDVYRATMTASVAILAWRSVLDGGMPYDIPDFRRQEDRKRYENDTLSPYPNETYEADIPCSSQPYAPTEDDLQCARNMWRNADYLVR